MLRARLLAGLVFTSFCLACSTADTSTTPSITETTPVATTEIFSGLLGVGETKFYSFTALNAGTTRVLLASLRPGGAPDKPLATPLGIALGTPAGTGCAASTAVTTPPGLTSQLSLATKATTYCVAVSDVGNLKDTVEFIVRIVHF